LLPLPATRAQAFRLGDDGRPGEALVVKSERELVKAFEMVDEAENMCTCNLIEVQVNNDDFSEELRLVGAELRKKNALSDPTRSGQKKQQPLESPSKTPAVHPPETRAHIDVALGA
jgi:hypothetical protein